ncbi:MAG: SecDF P1 head subdomain-containing protein [Gemmatimonadales bacterium]
MRPVWALLAAAAGACAPADTGMLEPVVLEVRFVDPAPEPGSLRLPVRGSTDRLAVGSDLLLTGADLADVQVQPTPLSTLLPPGTEALNEVTLILTPDGASRLGRAIAGRTGRRLAVVLDGEVVAQPMIRGPLSEGVVVLAEDFSQREAQAIALELERARRP